MCREKQNGADAKRTEGKIDGREVIIWRELENWIPGLGWGEHCWTGGVNTGDTHIWYSGRHCQNEKAWNGKWRVWSWGRKSTPKTGGVTYSVDGCDRAEGVQRPENSWGCAFFVCVSCYFLSGVSRFGCGLRPSGSMWFAIARIHSSISVTTVWEISRTVEMMRDSKNKEWSWGKGW